jgi:organic hydroperoxide reductase OsmC/OhrA
VPGQVTATVRPKEFSFPLEVEWAGERRVAVRVEGKPGLTIAPPPVFRGVDPALWSPEDLFVAASASCLAVTLTGLAERRGLAIRRLSVHGEGIVGTRVDDRFGFTRIRLRVDIESEAPELARRLVEDAEETCLVTASLALPVEVEVVST